jgi:hypothetical protein
MGARQKERYIPQVWEAGVLAALLLPLVMISLLLGVSWSDLSTDQPSAQPEPSAGYVLTRHRPGVWVGAYILGAQAAFIGVPGWNSRRRCWVIRPGGYSGG